MRLISDPKKDSRTIKSAPGAYEWWYFDGIDTDGEYGFVIIFYDGNPFSTRYIKRLKHVNGKNEVFAEDHPAVSISIYRHQEPIYYSFTEFEMEECFFDDSEPDLQIGDHSMKGDYDSGILKYQINLKESLPSGDSLVGHLTFKSSVPEQSLFTGVSGLVQEPHGHLWNLVQPRAGVEGRLKIFARAEPDKEIIFKGTGYHDHNLGDEPMKNEFNEWYWGRFHFDLGTLIYYIMDRRDTRQQQGWLVSPDNGEILQHFNTIELEDMGWSKFGIKSARKILLGNEIAHVTIQQSRILDNGPFYQRFNSDSFINISTQDVMQVAEGISEYIRPDRIHWRIFWPFLHMRIRYRNGEPHWVQRSKTLYRWTW